MSAPFDREAMEILRFLLRRSIAGMVRVLKNPPPEIVEFEACREALRTLEATLAQLLALGDERRELSTELADVLDAACDVRDALASLKAHGFDPLTLYAFAIAETPRWPAPNDDAMQHFALAGDTIAAREAGSASIGEYLCIEKARAIAVANELFNEWQGQPAKPGRVPDSWKALRYFCKAMIGEAEELPQDSEARRWIVRICDGVPRWYVELDTAWRELLDRLSVWPESVELFERVAARARKGEA